MRSVSVQEKRLKKQGQKPVSQEENKYDHSVKKLMWAYYL